MDRQLQEIINRIERVKGFQVEKDPYHCKSCKDEGYVYRDINGYEAAVKCKCQLLKEAKNKMNNSGLGDLLETKTFENYIVTENYQQQIKDKAIGYVNEFLKGNKYSFAMLGQSGVGKTHIMTAVARKLIDENVNVKYYMADDITQILQSHKFDEMNYARRFGEIANAGVLFIDDLFKSSVQNYYNRESIKLEDFREVFKVINYRANKELPILLNSEIHFERFEEIDEAMIGRIYEMCNFAHYVSIKPDISKNYRLR